MFITHLFVRLGGLDSKGIYLFGFSEGLCPVGAWQSGGGDDDDAPDRARRNSAVV